MTAKYYIYRNLHKPGHFSIKQRGKVIDHQKSFASMEVEFRVSTAGQKRARDNRQRNVHAYAVAPFYQLLIDEHSDSIQSQVELLEEITYNPFNTDQFVWKDSNDPITTSVDFVIFQNGKVYGQQTES